MNLAGRTCLKTQANSESYAPETSRGRRHALLDNLYGRQFARGRAEDPARGSALERAGAGTRGKARRLLSYWSRSVERRCHRQAFSALSNVLWPGRIWASRPTTICCVGSASTSSPTMATIPVRSRSISSTATYRIRRGIRRWHRSDSGGFFKIEGRRSRV
jgi:hypothetical protein